MSFNHNDLTFFTNQDDNDSLLSRFQRTLQDVQQLDILVGYFRTSGFKALQADLQPIEKIRILVGLNVDRATYHVVDELRQRTLAEWQQTSYEAQAQFSANVASEITHTDDSHDVEESVRTFMQMLEKGQIEIKAHPSQNIHAKVYIQRFGPEDRDFGRVITGSSNFSYYGLKRQYEFNVELKNSADVHFALAKFEELWAEGIDLSAAYIDTIRQRTWLNDQITPYQLYLKFLYEYFQEEINSDHDFDIFLPDGFMELDYQKQAVIAAKRILHTYNGVFLADVVGLGKTFIAALLAQQLDKGRILIICPPVLQQYWEKTFEEFRVPAKVESLGKLDQLIQAGTERYDYVFVDEAHRFRNENTQRYEQLHQICAGKKVILVSATPLNNKIDDIESQLKLFQPARKSIIPGVPNLERFFQDLRGGLNQYEKGSPEYVTQMKEMAREVRLKILHHVMVRRTRREIEQFYSADIQQQGLFFPQVAPPERIVYSFDEPMNAAFERTMKLIQSFHYARYTPRLYLREELSALAVQSQRNIGAFMKGLLVKRLESSFHAFRLTVERFVASYERFIEMYDDHGRVLISPNVNVYDLLDSDQEEKLLDLIAEGIIDEYAPTDFKPDFRAKLAQDLATLHDIQTTWNNIRDDPKLAQFSQELQNNPLLVDQKVIVFTESAETATYLYEQLQPIFGGQIISFDSGGGHHNGQKLPPSTAKERIEANFSPGHHHEQDGIRLLITTDVLAEGINLHRAHIVVNYDLPWNPTRVLQRVGRVNRVGAAHEQVYIFNFFPTAVADKHLGLENNIVAKIQAFHDMLGEDARYLSEDEELSQHDLSGKGRALYRKLNRPETYVGEEDQEMSDLAYLQVIRQVRDDDPALFAQIKSLPVKARSGWNSPLEQAGHKSEQLVTFFRHGRVKRFFRATLHENTELDFFTAADLLACDPDTPRQTIPKIYYELLAQNKNALAQTEEEEQEPTTRRGGGHSHAKLALTHVRAALKDKQQLTHDNVAFLQLVRQAFEEGRVSRKVSQRIMERITKLGKRVNPLKTLHILRDEVSAELLRPLMNAEETGTARGRDTVLTEPGGGREIVLSAYLGRAGS